MPTDREAVLNQPLSGLELKQLILRDVGRLLDSDGMLSPHVAYGRCAYDIRIRLHVDNAMNRESTSHAASRLQAKGDIERDPAIAAVESAPPLRDPSPESVAAGVELTRTITSPNSERLNAGLPITVDTREQDGSRVQRAVTYPIPEPGDVPEDVTERDITVETLKDWDLQAPQPPAAPAAPIATETVTSEPAAEPAESKRSRSRR